MTALKGHAISSKGFEGVAFWVSNHILNVFPVNCTALRGTCTSTAQEFRSASVGRSALTHTLSELVLPTAHAGRAVGEPWPTLGPLLTRVKAVSTATAPVVSACWLFCFRFTSIIRGSAP